MENKTLWESKLLRWVIIFGAVIAVFSSLVIINSTDNLALCVNSACFTSFLELFDFPLKVLSATFFIAGFIAVIHRSKQTYHQIEIAQEQNQFSNYFTHKKEFIDSISRFAEERNVLLASKSERYHKFFPTNTPYQLDIISKGESDKNSIIFELAGEYNVLIDELKGFDFNDKSAASPVFANWVTKFMLFSKKLGVIPIKTRAINSNSIHHFMIYKELPTNFSDYIYTIELLIWDWVYFCLPKEKHDKLELKDAYEFNNNINKTINEFLSNVVEP